MIQKPHIRKELPIAYNPSMWSCSGEGHSGMGNTPYKAYEVWLYLARKNQEH